MDRGRSYSVDNIRIKQYERCFFTGKTGSGKTECAKYFLDQFPYWVVLDNKGMFSFPGAALVRDFDNLYKAAKTHKRIVYRPPAELEANKTEFMETMDAFFWWIYQRQNCICYIDEVTAVSDSYNILPGHNALMKRGRELNIGCWNASQQPVNCHNTLISEAEHHFVFTLNLESHRKKLALFMGDTVLERLPQDYSFYYFNQAKMIEPIHHEKLDI